MRAYYTLNAVNKKVYLSNSASTASMQLCMNAKCKIVQQLYYDFVPHCNTTTQIKYIKSTNTYEYVAEYAHVHTVRGEGSGNGMIIKKSSYIHR